MNKVWECKEEVIGKSGDSLLVRRSVDVTPSGGQWRVIVIFTYKNNAFSLIANFL